MKAEILTTQNDNEIFRRCLCSDEETPQACDVHALRLHCCFQRDKLIRRGFENHNRMHIAAMAMQGLLANPGISDDSVVQDATHIDYIAEYAFTYADALISESNKAMEQEE